MKITPKQIAFIQSRMIDLGYEDRPDFFWEWRSKKDGDKMFEMVKRMSAIQASYIISHLYTNDYNEAINRWEILESISLDLRHDSQATS